MAGVSNSKTVIYALTQYIDDVPRLMIFTSKLDAIKREIVSALETRGDGLEFGIYAGVDGEAFHYVTLQNPHLFMVVHSLREVTLAMANTSEVYSSLADALEDIEKVDTDDFC